jgi:glyceraldehyde-3-phosphate dehydrogenase (NADP+)
MELMTRGDDAFPLDVIKYGRGRQCLTRRFPVGVVLAIIPYNWPLNLGAHKFAPALAVGCPLLARPASLTPISTLLLAEIYHEAGVPAGLFNVIPCPVPLAERAALDPRVKMVSFTGSPAVGWALKARAADKKVALELGGNAACILEAETDLDFAIPRLALGCFGYAGQICISVQRILVQQSIRVEFERRFSNYLAQQFPTGDPRDEKVLCGPLIDTTSTDKVMAWIEEAKTMGANVVTGGRRLGPRLIEPTLLAGVAHSAKVWRQEVFGPLAVLESYQDFEQALALANDSDYGINCGVFTNDLNKAFRAFERLEVGCVVINDYPTFRIDSMPYGGVKQSGFGREGVRYAMEEMTEIRGLILNLTPDSGQ